MVFDGHQKVLVVIISHFPATAKLQRLCGQESYLALAMRIQNHIWLDRLYKYAV